MPQQPNCGGLRIDQDTLKVNAKGELYVSGGGGSSVEVTELINGQRTKVAMGDLPTGHTILGTALFDDYTDNMNNYIVTIGDNINGLKFTDSVKNGWKVHSSQTGLIIANLELDYNKLTWSVTQSPGGCYIGEPTIQELLPTGLFNFAPNVTFTCYCSDANYSFLTTCLAAPSKDYMGEWRVIMMDKLGTGANKPTLVHLMVQAIGF